MTYDDLKSTPVCQFKSPFPAVDPREVHIVMWRSRPATADVCSRRVPTVRSATVSAPVTSSGVCLPQTAKVTTSSLPKLPMFVPAGTGAYGKFEQQLKATTAVFSFWPPVIAGAIRQKVRPTFYLQLVCVVCCPMCNKSGCNHGRSLSWARRGAKPPLLHEATYFQAFLDGGYCDNNMFNGW